MAVDLGMAPGEGGYLVIGDRASEMPRLDRLATAAVEPVSGHDADLLRSRPSQYAKTECRQIHPLESGSRMREGALRRHRRWRRQIAPMRRRRIQSLRPAAAGDSLDGDKECVTGRDSSLVGAAARDGSKVRGQELRC
jgi:hypothetical protein